jgi:hypothetical protein|tara:strand:- start:721 stop:1311 length:591 start_codon:yes stop_codon:yes gene_type:complete
MELITDEEMDRIVNKEIAFVSDQLFINAQKICTYNYEKWGADLVSHTVMYFLNQPIQKKYSIVTSPSVKVPALERYLTSAMSLAIRSSTSPFYSAHRKHIESHRVLFDDYDYSSRIGFADAPDDDGDIWLNMKEQLPLLIDKLHFYDRYLIQKHYLEQMTVGEMSKLTQITSQRLSKDIKSALIELKKQLTLKNHI